MTRLFISMSILFIGGVVGCRSMTAKSHLQESIDLRDEHGRSELLLLRDGAVRLYICDKSFPANGEHFVAEECLKPSPSSVPVALDIFDRELRKQLKLAHIERPKEHMDGLQKEIDAIEKRVLELRYSGSPDADNLEKRLQKAREQIAQLKSPIEYYVHVIDHLVTGQNTRFYQGEKAYSVSRDAYAAANDVQFAERIREIVSERSGSIKAAYETCQESVKAKYAHLPVEVSYDCETTCQCATDDYCNGGYAGSRSDSCWVHDKNGFLKVKATVSESDRSNFKTDHCKGQIKIFDYIQEIFSTCRPGQRHVIMLRRTPSEWQLCKPIEKHASDDELRACSNKYYREISELTEAVRRELEN